MAGHPVTGRRGGRRHAASTTARREMLVVDRINPQPVVGNRGPGPISSTAPAPARRAAGIGVAPRPTMTDPTAVPAASTTALPQAVLTPLTGAAHLPGRADRSRGQRATRASPRAGERPGTVGRVPGPPSGSLSCVTGIGANAAGTVSSAAPAPRELHPFVEVSGAEPSRRFDSRRPALPHPRRTARPAASSWPARS